MVKKTTIEELARMVKAGFDETATKHEVRAGFQALADTIDIVRQDVHDIKSCSVRLFARCQ